MIIFHLENIKLIQISEFLVLDFLITEVKKYCYMWRDGGQFSTEKYTALKILKNKT